MESFINIGVNILFFVLLPALGFFVGSTIEKNHFKRLAKKEKELSSILTSDMRTIPEDWVVEEFALVQGSVVIATDYFKVLMAFFRNLIGGRVNSLVTLAERARREAIVRMLQKAKTMSADAVWNVRIETCTIQGKQQPKGVEVIAYGTALRLKH